MARGARPEESVLSQSAVDERTHTVFIINRVMRDQVANISSIDKKAKIYRHGKKDPVILIDDQKPRTRR
mgnify:CR=1 FL=1